MADTLDRHGRRGHQGGLSGRVQPEAELHYPLGTDKGDPSPEPGGFSGSVAAAEGKLVGGRDGIEGGVHNRGANLLLRQGIPFVGDDLGFHLQRRGRVCGQESECYTRRSDPFDSPTLHGSLPVRLSLAEGNCTRARPKSPGTDLQFTGT